MVETSLCRGNELFAGYDCRWSPPRGGATDPSTYWAKGEIGFFDFYIIPLAKKLKECGVFGVSSDEYLQYAISNRNEWEVKGESILGQLMDEVREEFESFHASYHG